MTFSPNTLPLANPSPTLLRRIESPKNFSVKDVQLDVTTMNVTLTWQKSDPPADGYQVRLPMPLSVVLLILAVHVS